MRSLLPIAAAAFAISATGAAYAGPPLKVGIKDNKNVTKVDVKAPGTLGVKVMDNPSNLKVKVQAPGTGKVQVKLPSPL